MLPLPYTQRSSFGIFAAYLRRLKAELPPKLRTRTVKGVKQHYLVPQKGVSDGAQHTFRQLLIWQIDAVEALHRVPFLLEAATDQAPEHRTPPPVATNNETLARARGVSSRAIRNHLTELLKVGVITRKEGHGWCADFELFIAPEFVWKKAAQTAQNSPKKRHYAPSEATAPSTKVPPFVTQDRQATREIVMGAVEKLVPHEAPAGAAELTGHTGPQPALKPAPKRPAAPPQATKSVQGGAAAAEHHAEHLAWCTQAWHYAWKRLYPARQFDEHQQRNALNAIWYGVYRGFDGRASEAEYQQFHHDVLQRIDLVAGYLERHGKTLPAPYAEFVPGAGYFDQDNALGFRATEQWLQRHQTTNHERSIVRALLLARRQFRAHRLGIANKRTQALTSAQLYRHHEDKLRRLGPGALQRYYAQVASPKPDAARIAFTPLPQVTAATPLSWRDAAAAAAPTDSTGRPPAALRGA